MMVLQMYCFRRGPRKVELLSDTIAEDDILKSGKQTGGEMPGRNLPRRRRYLTGNKRTKLDKTWARKSALELMWSKSPNVASIHHEAEKKLTLRNFLRNPRRTRNVLWHLKQGNLTSAQRVSWVVTVARNDDQQPAWTMTRDVYAQMPAFFRSLIPAAIKHPQER